ncbi:hypothetical protein JCGZ_06107 [Jatropha curcas]|uniref:non-specific serine/threonine protein kinase n=1 Tax=Jatropha curcas TaxID=180498 RepID=A0A067KLC4_JATCU|nr:hypothetical protein JCGZ_06107 [Jatropha curcas]
MSLQVNASGNDTDLIALLKFKEAITSDPNRILDSWNDSTHFCNWFGISCNSKDQRVKSLILQGQNLFGPISPYIGNLSFLSFINLKNNSFSGQIPQEIGKLSVLQYFFVTNNSFEGEIPSNLSLCSQLRKIDLQGNNFSGRIPSGIGSLVQLQELWLGKNNLNGEIPASLGNLSSLNVFYVTFNNLTGNVPDDIGRLKRLRTFAIGEIPSSLANLTQLSILFLSRNRFEGNIPSNFGNLKNLNCLLLSQNNLSGAIPHEILSLSSLSQALDLSQNSLMGNLPQEIGKLTSLTTLLLFGNNLSGEIPTTIGNCLGLEYLYMQDNYFQGIIPPSLASLKGLQYLDLSQNNLSGEVPKGLESIQFLVYLNLSFNSLEGEIPNGGVFQNVTALSLIGNNKLCGGVEELNLPKCPKMEVKKGKSLAFKLAIISSCLGALCAFFMLAFILLFYKRSKLEKNRNSESSIMDSNPEGLACDKLKISYSDIFLATNGFSSSNLIGCGSFGSVYKGFLHQVRRPVAIKVIKLQVRGASKSFKAECKVLMNIRHRNLIKMLGYCSGVDGRVNIFKALVFEFMGNGSLDMWLHPDNQSKNLSLVQRLNIALDIAQALHYLHDNCKTAIVHCDLKPSNVLLDDDMVAHVCDFGLAKLLSNSQSQFSTNGMKGTIGYAAPEYGMGCEASRMGDVYSYGILVLEMFTGKRPTDEMFKDGLNLHDFVKQAWPRRLLEIIDPNILAEESKAARIASEKDVQHPLVEEEDEGIEKTSKMSENVQECLVSVFEIGLRCSAESARRRIKMSDVVEALDLIKRDFLEGSNPTTISQDL